MGLRNAIQALQAPVRKRRIRRRPAEEIWQDNLSTEVRFWRRFLTTGGSEWPDEYAFRCDPDAELQEHVKAVIDLPAGAVARILDVGARPLTYLGKRWEGRTVEITAVDALADEYDRLLDEVGIEPPVRTAKCDSEHLLDRFSPDSFDLAYARNALDHGYDPLGALSQMVTVVKPRGRVLITVVDVPAPLAALGTTIQVPTLEGDVPRRGARRHAAGGDDHAARRAGCRRSAAAAPATCASSSTSRSRAGSPPSSATCWSSSRAP